MRRLLLLALPALLAGCVTTRVTSFGEEGGMAPILTVERFLQAVNVRDLHTMARLFGTEKGPIIETGSTGRCAFKKLGSWFGMGSRCQTIQEVEIRMDAIARILRHQDYTLASEGDVPGRVHRTSRVAVHFQMGGGREVRDVPFTVVRTPQGRWLIEEIGLARVTGR